MSLRSGEVIEPGLLASDDPQHGARESWRVKWQRLLPLTISTTFQNFTASFVHRAIAAAPGLCSALLEDCRDRGPLRSRPVT
jgi:hypothetical protein